MLRHSFATESEIPAELRAFYDKGQDGKFYLQVEGMVPKARHDEFRDNNQRLERELSEEKAKTSGLNIVRAKELLQLDAEGKIVKKGEGGGQDIEAQVAERTKTMKDDFDRRMTAQNETHAKALKDADDKAKKLGARLSTTLIDEAIAKAALAQGARPEAIDDIRARARGTFQLEGDEIVAKDSQGNKVYGKDGMKSLTIEEYVTGLPAAAPHLFKETRGTGAGSDQREVGADGKTIATDENPWITGNLTLQGEITKKDAKRATALKQAASIASTKK